MQEQHPVPQQISSYQFRLVGDMTLKQFFELAGGCLVGLLFYSSNLPTIVKWPIIIFCVIFGIALAFLPFEDRPLEIWIVAFFRSIYQPTIYFWQKIQKSEEYFQAETGRELPLGVIVPGGAAELNKYLAQMPDQKNPILISLEEAEKTFLNRVTGLFSGIIPQVKQQPAEVLSPQPIAAPVPHTIVTFDEAKTQRRVETNKKVVIPKTEFIRATASQPKDLGSKLVVTPTEEIRETSVAPIFAAGKDMGSVKQAQFSESASPPMPPTQPNTLSGQVMDMEGKIIEAAILEIKDAAGRPVRAVKTNKLGHFFIVTPLGKGVYEILTEKDGYEFDPVRFNAEDQLIPPIAIRSKNMLTAGVGEIN